MPDGTQDGPIIDKGSILSWIYTMNLVGGTPDFSQSWPFKFTTTTGGFDVQTNPAGKVIKSEWIFGGYQNGGPLAPCPSASQCAGPPPTTLFLTMPEPATLLMLGGGLVAVANWRRRRMPRA